MEQKKQEPIRDAVAAAQKWAAELRIKSGIVFYRQNGKQAKCTAIEM